MTDKFYERAIRWFDEQPPRSNYTHARQSLAICLREMVAAERERIQQIVIAVILGGVCRRPKDGHECGLPAIGIDLEHNRPLCAGCLKSPGVEGLPLSDLFEPSRTEDAATATEDPGPSRVDLRPRACCICARVIAVESSTTPHPEAPEMLKVPPDAWVGFVQGDHAPEMILVCSESCRRTLLSA